MRVPGAQLAQTWPAAAARRFRSRAIRS